MTTDGRISRRLRISGSVQGVWYRQWTVENARRLGLDGWVRNRSDGTVEAVVAGATDPVEALIAACHEGPPAARVQRVDVADWSDPVEPGFHGRPTV